MSEKPTGLTSGLGIIEQWRADGTMTDEEADEAERQHMAEYLDWRRGVVVNLCPHTREPFCTCSAHKE